MECMHPIHISMQENILEPEIKSGILSLIKIQALHGIPYEIISDNTAWYFLKAGKV